MGRSLTNFLVGVGLVLNLAVVAFGQEEANNDLYAFGSAVTISPEAIVLSEYDYDSDAEVQVTYAVTPETKFEEMASIQDVKANDYLEIEYTEAEGKRTATLVAKDNSFMEDSEDNATGAPADDAPVAAPAVEPAAETAPEAAPAVAPAVEAPAAPAPAQP